MSLKKGKNLVVAVPNPAYVTQIGKLFIQLSDNFKNIVS